MDTLRFGVRKPLVMKIESISSRIANAVCDLFNFAFASGSSFVQASKSLSDFSRFFSAPSGCAPNFHIGGGRSERAINK